MNYFIEHEKKIELEVGDLVSYEEIICLIVKYDLISYPVMLVDIDSCNVINSFHSVKDVEKNDNVTFVAKGKHLLLKRISKEERVE